MDQQMFRRGSERTSIVRRTSSHYSTKWLLQLDPAVLRTVVDVSTSQPPL